MEDIFYIGVLLKMNHNSYLASMDKNEFKLIRLLLLFCISSALSLVFYSISTGYAIVSQDINSLFSLVKISLVFYISLWLGSKSKFKDANQLILILSGGLFISSILSIIQYLDIGGLGSYIFLLYGKEESMQYGISRSIGSIGNPNYAAFFHIIGLISLFSLNVKKYYIIYYTAIVLVVLSTILTFSRTGLIALLFVSFISLVYKKKYKALIMLYTLGVLVVIPNINYFISNTRYAIIGGNNDTFDVTLNGRTDMIWSQKLQFFFENILLGIGSAKNENAIGNNLFAFTVFDNSYLYLLVTAGIIGVIIYFSFIYVELTLFIEKKNYLSFNVKHFVILLHTNVLIFFITTDLIKNIYFISYFYFIIGVMISFYKIPKKVT
jgi:hypothetical protein